MISLDGMVMTDEGMRLVRDRIGTPFGAIINGKRVWVPGFTEVGQRDFFLVETVEGHSIECTEDQLFALNCNNGKTKTHDCIDYPIPLKSLVPGQELRLHNHQNLEWDSSYEFDEGDGELLGLWVGDGRTNINRSGEYPRLLFHESDHCLLKHVQQILEEKGEYNQW